ncbi:hypothetical protein [Acaryochloris sp. CCMEE 5410]|uniref:hypothetical protein n=1 Tax=Acaryochloris sp. CCMEE 5410 TaxID=310037 RepID=UPI00058549CC|nr:hypothetical protein [Acaryochloris sp. CCMEE 5410]KAI9129492.1 hypothetical protein ON05_034755 [Acaryochloris sp. CCMEE 5410]
MDFLIKPYESVGPVKLGMTPKQVHKALNCLPKTFVNPDSDEIRDYFGNLGLHIVYRAPSHRCDRILLFLPANPIFLNRSLLKRLSFEKLNEWIKSMDESAIMTGFECVSYKFGFVLITPSFKLFKHKRPKEVIVFKEGLYDYLKN